LSIALTVALVSIALSLSSKRCRFVVCSIGWLVAFTGEKKPLCQLLCRLLRRPSVATSTPSLERRSNFVGNSLSWLAAYTFCCFVAFSREYGVEDDVKTGGPGPRGGSRALKKEDGGTRRDKGMAPVGDVNIPAPRVVTVRSRRKTEATEATGVWLLKEI
jgi:hypothetical protein